MNSKDTQNGQHNPSWDDQIDIWEMAIKGIDKCHQLFEIDSWELQLLQQAGVMVNDFV